MAGHRSATSSAKLPHRTALWNSEGGPAFVRSALRKWESVWETPDIASTITVVFSSRLHRTLGRASPASGRVALHAGLRSASRHHLLEVLCHEVAHIVVVRRAMLSETRRPKAHGAEWASLVRTAGFSPSVRARLLGDPQLTTPASGGRTQEARERTYRVVHTCPVCQSRRMGRRAVRSWRCAECVAAGLDGILVISRLGSERP